MNTIEINATLRKELGKKNAKKLRRSKEVPCVLYGGSGNFHFNAPASDFRSLVYTQFAYVVTLNLGGKSHLALMKEIQFHPVTDDILHIDFIEVKKEIPITVDLPITITGTSPGVLAGGKLKQRKKYLHIKGLMDDIPESLPVDITPLNIGQSILAGDLQYDKIEILDHKQSLVIGVISSRLAAKSADGTTEGAAGGAAEAKK